MVKLLEKDNVPECYKDWDPDHYFFELYDDKGVYAYVAAYFEQRPYVNFHIKVVRFGHKILQTMKMLDWPEGIRIMDAKDAKIIVASKVGTREENKSYNKLLKHFGFSEPLNYTIATRNVKD